MFKFHIYLLFFLSILILFLFRINRNENILIFTFFIIINILFHSILIRVKLEGQESHTIEIKGNVVTRSLELLSSYNEEHLDCVKFGSTFYGTDKTESALLYNNGPEPVGFVCVLEENAVGQELVSSIGILDTNLILI